MTKAGDIYKCEICGNVVSVNEEGTGTLVCCDKKMIRQDLKTSEEGNEKHRPIIEIENNKVKVRVGSIEHPMEENHHIRLIQLIKDNTPFVEKWLTCKDKPYAEFCINNHKGITARAFCNIHGLWSS